MPSPRVMLLDDEGQRPAPGRERCRARLRGLAKGALGRVFGEGVFCHGGILLILCLVSNSSQHTSVIPAKAGIQCLSSNATGSPRARTTTTDSTPLFTCAIINNKQRNQTRDNFATMGGCERLFLQ